MVIYPNCLTKIRVVLIENLNLITSCNKEKNTVQVKKHIFDITSIFTRAMHGTYNVY